MFPASMNPCNVLAEVMAQRLADALLPPEYYLNSLSPEPLPHFLADAFRQLNVTGFGDAANVGKFFH